jgi:U4/U6 small nuclear ribonucleoprotein PRP4
MTSEGETLKPSDKQKQLLQEFERKRKAREIAVPTDDAKVKSILRQLGHPICIFGELAPDRRERLRDVLSRLESETIEKLTRTDKVIAAPEEEEDIKEEFYTEGSEELKEARKTMAAFSLQRAKDRIQRQKQAQQQQTPSQIMGKKRTLFSKLKSITNFSSQVGSNRPLASCSFSPNSQWLATGSWGGECKIWSIPHCKEVHQLLGPAERIGTVVFHPYATISQDVSAVNLVSCTSAGLVYLWSLAQETPIGELRGHLERIARCAFHPSGRFLGTASYDTTWRLWDIETRRELLLQEGHSKEVYAIGFHPDGSLLGTGDLDAIGRIWDLRTGRSIMVLQGHAKDILSIDFSGNGYHVATGSEDGTVRIWDLRKHRPLTTIPAHTSIVQHVRFQTSNFSDYLVTCSFDQTIKLFSALDWRPLKTLIGHERQVTCVDIARDGTFLASTSLDRTFKLWSHENCQLLADDIVVLER